MRAIVLAACACAVIPAAIAQDPFLTGEALQAEIARNCEEGCIVLSREEAKQLTRNVAGIVAEREAAAYRQGSLSCRNAI